jgi:hypothetical protein
MSLSALPPDDRINPRDHNIDLLLCRQLENTMGQHFYEGCDSSIQELLNACEWYLASSANALTLVIRCPDFITNWRVLNDIDQIGLYLEPFSRTAKVLIYPPPGLGEPLMLRVDEISVYKDIL